MSPGQPRRRSRRRSRDRLGDWIGDRPRNLGRAACPGLTRHGPRSGGGGGGRPLRRGPRPGLRGGRVPLRDRLAARAGGVRPEARGRRRGGAGGRILLPDGTPDGGGARPVGERARPLVRRARCAAPAQPVGQRPGHGQQVHPAGVGGEQGDGEHRADHDRGGADAVRGDIDDQPEGEQACQQGQDRLAVEVAPTPLLHVAGAAVGLAHQQERRDVEHDADSRAEHQHRETYPQQHRVDSGVPPQTRADAGQHAPLVAAPQAAILRGGAGR